MRWSSCWPERSRSRSTLRPALSARRAGFSSRSTELRRGRPGTGLLRPPEAESIEPAMGLRPPVVESKEDAAGRRSSPGTPMGSIVACPASKVKLGRAALGVCCSSVVLRGAFASPGGGDTRTTGGGGGGDATGAAEGRFPVGIAAAANDCCGSICCCWAAVAELRALARAIAVEEGLCERMTGMPSSPVVCSVIAERGMLGMPPLTPTGALCDEGAGAGGLMMRPGGGTGGVGLESVGPGEDEAAALMESVKL